MRKASKLVALVVGLATMLMVGVGAAGTASAAPRTADATTVPIEGTTENGGTFDGTFDVERFQSTDGTLEAVGTLTGTITEDGTTQTVEETVAMPVDLAASNGTCDILNLVLGPLDLNLLGLQVDLEQVVLDITAQEGPGQLLGNLLCAVAGLLDGPTGLSALVDQIANLLNRVLGVLG